MLPGMKQRRKQPVQTRQAILEAVGVELSQHGYAGTGIAPIVERAGLTKGALFHHFPDKRALILAWIGEHLTSELEALWTAPLEAVASLEALRAFCRTRCLALHPGDAISVLVSLTAETAAVDPLLGGALQGVMKSWRDAVERMLERGKTEGWIHKSIQPSAEAVFFVACFSGFSVTRQSDSDEGTLRVCAAAMEGYLETLRVA